MYIAACDDCILCIREPRKYLIAYTRLVNVDRLALYSPRFNASIPRIQAGRFVSLLIGIILLVEQGRQKLKMSCGIECIHRMHAFDYRALA